MNDEVLTEDEYDDEEFFQTVWLIECYNHARNDSSLVAICSTLAEAEDRMVFWANNKRVMFNLREVLVDPPMEDIPKSHKQYCVTYDAAKNSAIPFDVEMTSVTPTTSLTDFTFTTNTTMEKGMDINQSWISITLWAKDRKQALDTAEEIKNNIVDKERMKLKRNYFEK